MSPWLNERKMIDWERAATRERRATTSEPSAPHGAWCILVIGGLETGKSTLAERIAKSTSMSLIDPDMAPTWIPDGGGIDAGAVHPEAQYLTAQASTSIRAKGGDMVRVMVGTDAEALMGFIADLRPDGYQVHLAHLTLDPTEALRRLLHRFLDTGRFTRPADAREIAAIPPRTFDTLTRAGVLDGWIDLDVSGPPGTGHSREKAGIAPASLADVLPLR